ncbi:MAG: hypothetical protein V8S26_02200 [Lachnospiraceae bacterium]
MEHIAESLCTNIGMNGKYFAVRDGRINVIYQNRKEDINAELLERVSAGKRGYVIYERDGHRYMRIVSTAKMPATEKTYYLETISDMDTVCAEE